MHVVLVACVALLPAAAARAADEPEKPGDEGYVESGEGPAFTPGKGFTVARTEYGELTLSAYFLVRYLNQLPAEQSFVDHLGREQAIDTRNDINLHRFMMWASGWAYTEKLRYTAIFWTVNNTAQVAIGGYIGYRFHRAINLFAGYVSLPGVRSMLAEFPYFFATDRTMADDFFRPGFTGGAWVTGEPVRGFSYSLMLGNTLSNLNINAAKLTRALTPSASVWVMPTTGEFGARMGYGDYERHDKLATRFGASFTHSSENRFSQPTQPTPDNTQLRLTDSLLLFQTGSLADGVTLINARFDLLSFDAGAKWHGFHLQADYYRRWLSHFVADGPLPVKSIVDQGFQAQLGYVLPSRWVGVYGGGSAVFGEFNDSFELMAGVNVYPFKTRNFRVNGQVIYVRRSAQQSLFGYYTGGQTGPTLSLAADLFF